MSQSDIDLRKQTRLYHGDGLIDLAFGLVVLGIGLAELLGWQPSILFIFIILLVPLEQALKQRITAPRMGTISFVPPPNVAQRQRRALLITGVGAALVVLLFLVPLLIGPGALAIAVTMWLQRGAPLLWLIVGFGVLSLFAWTVDAKRVYLYLGLLAVVVLSGAWVPPLVPILLTLVGVSIAIVGAVLLARFMRGHPLPAGSAS
jgi:hypothetical protein